MHHFAHAQNDLTTGHVLGGLDGKKMAEANRQQAQAAAYKPGGPA